MTSGCLSGMTICRYINCALVDMPGGELELANIGRVAYSWVASGYTAVNPIA